MFTAILSRPFGYVFARGNNDRGDSRPGKPHSLGSLEIGTSAARSVPDPVTTGGRQELIAGRAVADVITALTSDDAERAGEALTAIYETYFDRLWRFAYRRVHSTDVAKELVQDLFLTLWAGRAGLVIRDGLKVYLYTAVQNRVFKAGRHANVVARLEAAVESGTATPPAVGTVIDPSTALDETEASTVVATLLKAVSLRDRDVLTMRWFDRMTYQEIAAALGITLSQVRTILARNESRLLEAFDQVR